MAMVGVCLVILVMTTTAMTCIVLGGMCWSVWMMECLHVVVVVWVLQMVVGMIAVYYDNACEVNHLWFSLPFYVCVCL